jgi:hypothetical protein
MKEATPYGGATNHTLRYKERCRMGAQRYEMGISVNNLKKLG